MAKYSTGKIVILLFILTNLIYVIMLTVTIPMVVEYADGLKLLDMLSRSYTVDYVHELFSALGKDGRHAYLYIQIPVDMVYPLLFALNYSLMLAFFLKKLNKLFGPLFYFTLLPIISGIADYFENFGIIYLLGQYPEIGQSAVQICNMFSLLKRTSASVSFVFMLIILLWLGIKWIIHRNR